MARFVISVTSIQSRLPKVKPVLQSIIDNTTADMVYLSIDHNIDVKKEWLPFDKRFQPIRCQDYGPITKILGVCEKEKDPETLILTLDDDNIVTQDIVKPFKDKSLKYPNSALSMSGFCHGRFPFVIQFVVDNKKDFKVDWIQGAHGILYRRKFINNEEVLNYRKDYKLLFKNDDHKISAYMTEKGIDLISINYNPKKYLKKYKPCASVSAISGNSMGQSCNFFKDVYKISSKFHKEGIYKNNYGCSRSVMTIPLLIILILIVFIGITFLKGFNYKYFTISIIFIIVLIALLIYYIITLDLDNYCKS